MRLHLLQNQTLRFPMALKAVVVFSVALAACGTTETGGRRDDDGGDSGGDGGGGDWGGGDAGGDAGGDSGGDSSGDAGSCESPNPAGCATTGCGDGEVCYQFTDRCIPSSCFCDEGAWVCTEDCNGGVCVPAGGECESDAECVWGAEICEEGGCAACPGFLCDILCEDGWHQAERNGCPMCECVPDTMCEGPVHQACRETGCDAGYICDFSICVPSYCDCDPATGEWACTDDCGGGMCVPVESGVCDSDDDCEWGAEWCERGECVTCDNSGELCDMACRPGWEMAERNGCHPCECVPVGGCLSDMECAVGEVCIEAHCQVPACPEIYRPVCGIDGRTYGNPCEARAAHIAVAYEGECGSGGECRTDSDCGLGEYCLDGICRIDGSCPDVWSPVCGVDGRTYGNGCEAERAGVEIAHDGECRATECGSDRDCDVGWICIDGFCEFAGICPDIWAPVCGADGYTYSNACEAEAAGVEILYDGECEGLGCDSNADCPRDEICYPPTRTCSPRCAVDCIEYDPVCGVDGRTYGCGPESAWCEGVEVAYEGECGTGVACETASDCPPDQACVGGICGPRCVMECFRYDPVCGNDGVTYGCGAAEAECNGAWVLYSGECQYCTSDDECGGTGWCNFDAGCFTPPDCPMCSFCAGLCSPYIP